MELIFVGIDVAKDRLDIHVQPSGEAFSVSRDDAGLAELVRRVQPLGAILIALEATGGYEVVVAATLGGLIMGYGARIGFGCNIGAYFSGISSFSLHGWLWGASAIAGTYAGLKIRPLFGMSNPRPTDAVC